MTTDGEPDDDVVIRIECRTIDGDVYLKSADVVAGLRFRAQACIEHAESFGDPYPEEDAEAVVAWRVAAGELEARADAIQVAEMATLEENPGDSPEVRAKCPRCGRDVLVNSDGKMRRHNRWQGEPCREEQL